MPLLRSTAGSHRGPGYPLGALSSELMRGAGSSRLDIQKAFRSWQLLFLVRLQDSRKPRVDADPERLATAIPPSLEGGSLTSTALQDESSLVITLDAVLGHLETFAGTQ